MTDPTDACPDHPPARRLPATGSFRMISLHTVSSPLPGVDGRRRDWTARAYEQS